MDPSHRSRAADWGYPPTVSVHREEMAAEELATIDEEPASPIPEDARQRIESLERMVAMLQSTIESKEREITRLRRLVDGQK